MKRHNLSIITLSILSILLTACSLPETSVTNNTSKYDEIFNTASSEQNTTETQKSEQNASLNIPKYDGTPYCVVNENHPYFNETDLTNQAFETYSELDSLGRCGPAYACVGIETMPTEPRGEIGMIKPSGWHNVNYHELIDGNYIYNRCHLIGYQLSGENANEKNLITGTRYMNVEGMEPFENEIARYIKDTGNHVLYRVTPMFEQSNLVANGVLMEARSIEDDEICLCIHCYNIQPGITIDYATGENWITDNDK